MKSSKITATLKLRSKTDTTNVIFLTPLIILIIKPFKPKERKLKNFSLCRTDKKEGLLHNCLRIKQTILS